MRIWMPTMAMWNMICGWIMTTTKILANCRNASMKNMKLTGIIESR